MDTVAYLRPLKAKADQHSFFLMGDDDTEPPIHLPGVSLNLVEWPRLLVIGEWLGSALALPDLPDGVSLELVRTPGNRPVGDYGVSTPLMRFDSCAVMRKLVRPKVDALEMVLVINCRITML